MFDHAQVWTLTSPCFPSTLHLGKFIITLRCSLLGCQWEFQTAYGNPHSFLITNLSKNPRLNCFLCSLKPFLDPLRSHPVVARKPCYLSNKPFYIVLGGVCVVGGEQSSHLDKIWGKRPFPFFRITKYGRRLPYCKVENISTLAILFLSLICSTTLSPSGTFTVSSFLSPLEPHASATPELHWEWALFSDRGFQFSCEEEM